MDILNLNGQWKVSGAGYKEIDATVPGCIHTDLMNAGIIPDPYYRDNEKKLMWVGETDWEYSRCFNVDSDFLQNRRILLCCHGLDTLATIYINGKPAGKADNMFRKWVFDVKQYLVEGENSITVKFSSTVPYIAEKSSKRYLFPAGNAESFRVYGSNMIRKMQCNYGWDRGPKCVTCGIWKDIELKAYSIAGISDAAISQKIDGNEAVLKIRIELYDAPAKEIKAVAKASFKGSHVADINCKLKNKTTEMELIIKNPKLWWPNNMGEQNLYDIEILLMDNDTVIDKVHRRTGLRTLKLVRQPDEWGESFYFSVNGVPFFAKGANWIPADTFVTRISDDFYRLLISEAAKANMNFLRVWGGGIYESDVFYDLCDEYGICIWQDFMFACSAYPAYDPEFMENVKYEVIDNIKRIGSHACIALFCGNNELEQIRSCVNKDGSNGAMTWDEYKPLFDELIPKLVAEYAPHVDYWPSSPHTPGEIDEREDYNNPNKGDAHLWEVWHGKKPFEWYRTCTHRFNSEFGFQSFPQPSIVEEFTLPEDRNLTSYVMEYHQRSGIGNTTIMQYMLSWFKLPNSFNMLLWLSQILQGMAMKYAVEHWRRNMPRGMGTLYWQLNDCWPCPSWSSIDYKGNLKALHYMAKKFFAPVLLSAVEDIEKGTVDIYLTNDYQRSVSGKINCKIVNVCGNTVMEKSFAASVGPNSSVIANTIDVKSYVDEESRRRHIMFLEFVSETGITSDNAVFFTRPKHIELENPYLKAEIIESDGKNHKVMITANKPALWVWIDIEGINAKYSDMFFHMLPENPVTISITTENIIDADDITKRLKTYSLVDTF